MQVVQHLVQRIQVEAEIIREVEGFGHLVVKRFDRGRILAVDAGDAPAGKEFGRVGSGVYEEKMGVFHQKNKI